MINSMKGVLWDEDGEISNFLPVVTQLFWENGDSSKVWLKLGICQGEERTTLGPIPYAELDTLRFDKISPLFLCMDASGSSTDANVRQYIRKEVAARMRAESPGIFFAETGWNELQDGRHVYVAGKRIFGDIAGINYALAPSLKHILLPDMAGSDSEILAQFLKNIWMKSDILIPLVSYCIRSLLITPFAEAGNPLRFILYIMGRQGLGKTTTAQKFALPFDQYVPVRSPHGMIDAGSTPSALRKTFSALCDVPTVLDDVAFSTDTREQLKRKNTVADLVRFVANDSGFLRMCGNQLQDLRSRCGMIVTAELPLETASDITRCATVVLFEQMESFSADDRALTAAAVSRFLTFFAENYDRLVETIRKKLDRADGGGECPRQQQIYKEMETCFGLLLDYGQKLGVLDEFNCRKWRKRMDESLSLMLAHNRDLVQGLRTQNLENLAELIVAAIDTKELRIAKNHKKFHKTPNEYDGLMWEDKVCILPRALTAYLNQITGKNMTENALGKRLRACGLVEENAEGRTAAWKQEGFPRMIPFRQKTLEKQAKKG